MRGCLALRPRNQSVVPGWQGIETCPEYVGPTWRRLARKNQDVPVGLCAGARPSHDTRPSIEAVVRAGYSAIAADATFSLPSPFKRRGKGRTGMISCMAKSLHGLLHRIILHHSPIRICVEPGTWNVKWGIEDAGYSRRIRCLSHPTKKSVEYDFYYERMPLTICRIMAVMNMRLIPVKTP